MNITKRVPLFSEERFIQFRSELFNAWNHTQFSGVVHHGTLRLHWEASGPKLRGLQRLPNAAHYSVILEDHLLTDEETGEQ